METRSQSRQQEEQFTKLMALIQEQYAEQKQYAEKKQQFAEFTIQQQQLMQKQDEQWENIEKQQYHTDRAVEALQSNIASFKTVT